MITKEEQIDKVKRFLESYGTNKKMLTMMRYEREYFSAESDMDDSCLIPGGDEVLIKSRMFEVRRFVANFEDSNCKLLLFYHYIRGFSVEKCAEMMNTSRTSGFRLKKRALALAANKYFRNSPDDDNRAA